MKLFPVVTLCCASLSCLVASPAAVAVTALDDSEMVDVAAQGFEQHLQSLSSQRRRFAAESVSIEVPYPSRGADGELFLGGLPTLQEVVSSIGIYGHDPVDVNGVTFYADARMVMTAEGGIELPMPSEIDHMAFENFYLHGKNAVVGDIEFNQTHFEPESGITITMLR